MTKYTVFNSFAKTNSANIEYSIEINLIPTCQCDTYVDRIRFSSLCETGCPNYSKKWACPPFSPSFEQYAGKWKYLYVLHFRADLSQFSYIKNNYLKIKAANSILKSRADKFLRTMAGKYGNYISTGSCRLCKPCKCKIGQPCAHPELMSYSFEALGVDVDALVKACFNHPLLWYKRGNLPEYTSVVCGILTNEPLSVDLIKDEFNNHITN